LDRPEFTPAAESLSRFKRERMNAPTFGRDVAPLGCQSGTMGFARGAPLMEEDDGSEREK